MKLTILLLFLSITFISCIDLHRFIQYDNQLKQFGSRTTYFSAPAKTVTNETLDFGPVASFTRYVVLTDFDSVFNPKLWSETLERTDVVSLIVKLPKSFTKKQLKEFETLEKKLIKQTFQKSVYFCKEENLKNLLKDINESQEDLQLVVNSKEATVITPISLYNLQGTLKANDHKKAPTIAIMANYDTLSMIPELSSGLDMNGSGMIALFELSRLFSNLYKNQNTKGKYNFVFVLTSGGRFNYQGAKHWLKKVPIALLDSIEFSLCLEGLIGRKLFLHISKKTENKEIVKLYQIFQKTAAELEIPFQVVFKKINPGSNEINWEHEILSFKKLESATLSHFESPKFKFSKTPTFEGEYDIKLLERNIRFIAESFAKYIYFSKNTNISIFKGATDISSNHLNSWINTLKMYPRFSPSLTSESPILKGMKKTLSMFTNEVKEQKFELTTNYKFYSNGKVELQIFRVKSIWITYLFCWSKRSY
eukprot:gene9394-1605_t